jgi:hypothetical protein
MYGPRLGVADTMEAHSLERAMRYLPTDLRWKLCQLTLVGGGAFWFTNFLISRTVIAAEYRAALSISYLPMLVESLLGGLVVACLVGYVLLRYPEMVPTGDPVLKSLMLSCVALVVVTVVLEGPARFSMTGDSLRYFLVGALINVLRILTLGIAVGYVYKRWE